MHSITDAGSLARAIALSLNPELKNLLITRRDQLGGDIAGQARFLIAEPGDTLTAAADALGFPLFLDDVPAFEWSEQHGFGFELVFILDDSGFAHVLLVPAEEGIDPDLIRLCREVA